ncbi:unnamed protein product [Linum trigynum]|uniref:Uncharacterized protein n=1 Tax=Linum trigynum TaxID=586398 RepID=A0AAV2DQE7_9ROSI
MEPIQPSPFTRSRSPDFGPDSLFSLRCSNKGADSELRKMRVEEATEIRGSEGSGFVLHHSKSRQWSAASPSSFVGSRLPDPGPDTTMLAYWSRESGRREVGS